MPVQAPHLTESVPHVWVLQDPDSDSAGQAVPPDAGFTTVRVRVWLPPPHLTLHLLHGDHADTTQSPLLHSLVPDGQILVPK